MGLPRDLTLVHFGRRLEANAPRLAEWAGGAIVTGSQSGPLFDELTRSRLPLLLQDDGRELEQPSLLGSAEPWFLAQRGRVAAYTNPVRYVAGVAQEGHSAREALRRAVEEANSFRDAMVTLDSGAEVLNLFALHHHWLAGDRAELLEALRGVGGPVGIMLWHSDDPLRRPEAIEGALELVRGRGDVAVLRSDFGALGLQAHGAILGSIGVGTGTRHFTRPGLDGVADVSDKSPRLLVPSLLDYWKGTRIEAVGDDPLLRCECRVCGGEPLGRFADPALKLEAAEHSIEAWSRLADELRGMELSARESWWSARVTEALRHIVELEDRLYLPQPPSKQLTSWCEVIGVPVP
jgi:hypothetical protein